MRVRFKHNNAFGDPTNSQNGNENGFSVVCSGRPIIHWVSSARNPLQPARISRSVYRCTFLRMQDVCPDHLSQLIWSKTTTQHSIWYIHRFFSRFILRHSLSFSWSLSHFSECRRFDLVSFGTAIGDGIPTLRFVHNFMRFALHLWSVRRYFRWMRNTLIARHTKLYDPNECCIRNVYASNIFYRFLLLHDGRSFCALPTHFN